MTLEDAPQPSWTQALPPLAALWLLFGGLDLWLGLDGHRPTFTGNGIPPEHYYMIQAAFLGPVLTLGCAVWAAVSRLVALRLGASCVGGEALFVRFAWVFGVTVSVAYVVPDLIAYGGWGFGALAPTARVAAPICLVGLLVWSSKELDALGGVGMWRAGVASWVGLMALTCVVALVVR